MNIEGKRLICYDLDCHRAVEVCNSTNGYDDYHGGGDLYDLGEIGSLSGRDDIVWNWRAWKSWDNDCRCLDMTVGDPCGIRWRLGYYIQGARC